MRSKYSCFASTLLVTFFFALTARTSNGDRLKFYQDMKNYHFVVAEGVSFLVQLGRKRHNQCHQAKGKEDGQGTFISHLLTGDENKRSRKLMRFGVHF